jgi:ankyrin repeat protein
MILIQGGNTALHLATFLGAQDVVRALLDRGANRTMSNAKGFAPVDLLDDPEMRSIFEKYKD